jgi:protein-serine/threonine kinase
MLGKGDVGKVYLVREKKTDKLFAMKGTFGAYGASLLLNFSFASAIEKGSD